MSTWSYRTRPSPPTSATAEPLIITDSRRPSRADLATSDPAAAARAPTGILPLAGLRGIALLSDGAARITDRFGLLTWADVLAVIRDAGPGELIRQVRAAEASDPDGARWPRSKPPTTPPSCTGTCPIEYPPRQSRIPPLSCA